MTSLTINYQELINKVKNAAHAVLVSLSHEVIGSATQDKADGSIVTEADLAMQSRLQIELKKQYPDSVLLSEEMSPEEQLDSLNSGSPIWCLDPLDGTSNYANGIPYFAVSLSLIHNGEVRMAVVYDPIRNEIYSASEKDPALINNQNLHCTDDITDIRNTIAIIDFKRLETELSIRLVQQQPFASQRNFGASALDWCWLAANRGQIYLHGKQNIWDYSAGHFIFEKAGGYSCSLDGTAVFNHKLEGRSVVAAVNSTLLKNWNNWISDSN